MIHLGSKFIGTPVMSLQTGGEVARTDNPIIDPATLEIIGYHVSGPLLKEQDASALRMADVREVGNLGFIIDSIDELINPADIIKFNDIASLNFALIGTTVLDERRHKLGKVVDYTLETATFTVQQLTVKRPLLHSFNDTELVIHRTQIIEISRDAIVVHSEAKTPEPSRQEVSGSYVNPFRKSNPAPESIARDS